MLEAGGADAAARSATILNGHGAPSKRLGAVGDFYINDEAHSIYGPKRASGWGRPTSLIGPAGAPGSSGAAGTPGAPGASGSAGAQGYSILNGDGPPAASLGADNDFYIDTASTQLYGPKEGGVWGSPIPLTGSSTAAAVSSDGTDGLPTPTGNGLELVINTVAGQPRLDNITYNGADL